MLVLLSLECDEAYVHDAKAVAYNKEHHGNIFNICKPLFENFEIRTFEYAHFFNNNACIYLSTHTEWHEYFIKNYARSTFILEHMRKVFNKGIQYHRWDTNHDLPLEKETAEFITNRRKFNLWHDFTIYEHYQDSLVSFTFSTTENNYHINNFYINNIKLLTQFIMYFYQKAASIIKPPPTLKSLNCQKYLFYDCMPLETNNNNSQEEFTHDALPTTEYRWVLSEREIYLTPKELACMCYLTKGQSKEETAFQMGKISSRTVDTHEYNIKNKAGIRNRNKLRKEFAQSILYKLCQ